MSSLMDCTRKRSLSFLRNSQCLVVLLTVSLLGRSQWRDALTLSISSSLPKFFLSSSPHAASLQSPSQQVVVGVVDNVQRSMGRLAFDLDAERP